MKPAAYVRLLCVPVSVLLSLVATSANVIGRWSFDDPSIEKTLDESVNGNHLSLGGASFTEPGEGISGRALRFVWETDRPRGTLAAE